MGFAFVIHKGIAYQKIPTFSVQWIIDQLWYVLKVLDVIKGTGLTLKAPGMLIHCGMHATQPPESISKG